MHVCLCASVCVEAAAEAHALPLSLCCHARAGNIRLAQETHSLNSNAPPAPQIYKASNHPLQQHPRLSLLLSALVFPPLSHSLHFCPQCLLLSLHCCFLSSRFSPLPSRSFFFLCVTLTVGCGATEDNSAFAKYLSSSKPFLSVLQNKTLSSQVTKICQWSENISTCFQEK